MTHWILQLIDGGGYWGIAFLMFLENVFPPIPSELIMGLGGIRVGQGHMAMVPLLIAGTIGTTLGNYVWFLLGVKLGFARLRPIVERHGRWATIEWSHVETVNRLFEKYGPAIVFVMRFMPTFRTMVSLPAGLFRMGHVKFLVWTAAGAAIWNLVLAYAGFVLGYHFHDIDAYVGPVATGIVMLCVIGYLWRLAIWRPSGASKD